MLPDLAESFDVTVGILLHYDDPNQDLQDLYFIDPKWLCDLMARIVTLQQVNPYIYNGVLNLDNLPQVLKGDLFTHHNSPQFIRLLNRFQIACSLDDNRVLIPSKLPAEKPEEATNDDLPFITLKRIHSLPCIPHGFWSRLISRLLFYMKDMLSDGENFTRKEYSSPFQLDPFCCRCPLVLESLTGSVGLGESDQELLAATDPSMGGSFENLHESSADFQGFRFFGSPRQGTYINGRFFGFSDLDGASSRSDSGYEYSSEEDDEFRGRTRQPLNATFPFRQSRGESWRNKEVFKHCTDPGIRRDGEISAHGHGSTKSDSAFPILPPQNRQDSGGAVLFDAACTSSDEGSCATVTLEPRSPDATLEPANKPHEGNSTGKIDGSEDSCPGRKVISGSAPYQSATSRSCTPDPFPHDLTDGRYVDPSSARPSEDAEISPSQEDPIANGPSKEHSWKEAEVEETNRFYQSASRENLPSDHTPGSSLSNSISDKESSGEGFHTIESRRSSVSETQDSTTEVQTPHNDKQEMTGNGQCSWNLRSCGSIYTA